MVVIRRISFGGIIFSMCEVFTTTKGCLMNRMRARCFSITGSTFDKGKWRYCNDLYSVDIRKQGNKSVNQAILELLAARLEVKPEDVVINRMDVIEWKHLG